ncbi:MAG: retron Ec48 family effector membrane protein [Polynucleobacter sp.]|uniref:retron Ec48 family effector membrane protein n=1 Tax=Polynucleobacter sp. TaxID=2029855 RepID=UPI00272395F6|nr:retron Ec48 family effector membrane protein [Polynucleobacter sp.]MDO8715119.1 retron Ec48 family effector membrane protein [Polynucleobacter sp.]
MKSIKTHLSNQPRSLVVLCFALFISALFGLILTISSFTATVQALRIFALPLCFENACVAEFFSNFDQSVAIAKGTLDFLVALATSGGIVVALLSYLSNANTAALANHIAHFSIFQEYVKNEITKKNRISANSIDVLKLYNLIFSTSRRGKTDVSDDYINFVSELISLISSSNDQAQHAKDGSFRYKPHQSKIRDHLEKAGVTVFLSPRNDFFEMEDQIFALIDRINQSFCYSISVPSLPKKQYN